MCRAQLALEMTGEIDGVIIISAIAAVGYVKSGSDGQERIYPCRKERYSGILRKAAGKSDAQFCLQFKNRFRLMAALQSEASGSG
ncbi:hypothetical protein [Gimesia sp.]|uniref:hypothetical protein n=1 Tax=Gimesia sp. TaxID=2024833 RepID=UPI003A8CDFE4